MRTAPGQSRIRWYYRRVLGVVTVDSTQTSAIVARRVRVRVAEDGWGQEAQKLSVHLQLRVLRRRAQDADTCCFIAALYRRL